MLYYILILLVIYIIYVKIYKVHTFWNKYDIPQSSPQNTVNQLLNLFLRRKSFLEQTMDLYDEFPHKGYNGTYQLFRPTIIVRDLDIIKQITIKDFDSFTDHNQIITEDTDPLLAKSLINMRGNRWREMRATLSPAFTSSKMRSMFVLMVEYAEEFVSHFKNNYRETIAVDAKDIFTRYTNDMIASTSFGVKVNSLKEPRNEFYLNGKETTNFSGFAALKFLLLFAFPELMASFNIQLFPKRITSFFRNLVTNTITTREKQGIVRPDMIHLLMEARKGRLKHEDVDTAHKNDAGFATVEESQIGKTEAYKKTELTDDDLTAQALIFFFAGFETSSTLMSFLAYELAVNPDAQKKLFNEIDEVFESCDGKVSYEQILKMKYLDQVISETLRLWPPAVQTDRQCVKDYDIKSTKPNEEPLLVEEGWSIFIPIVAIHRNPEYFPNPYKFDPDRFSDENKSKIVPGSYMPFGVGPRSCIGSRFALLETKALFCYLLRTFELVVIRKTQIPLKLRTGTFNLIGEKGIWIGIKKRK